MAPVRLTRSGARRGRAEGVKRVREGIAWGGGAAQGASEIAEGTEVRWVQEGEVQDAGGREEVMG